MPQVSIAAAADHFGAVHAVAEVFVVGDSGLVYRRPVAGPAATGVKLGVAVEQRRIAADAVVYTRLALQMVLAGKGAFSAPKAAYLVLRFGELSAPVLIRFAHFVHCFLREVCRTGFLRRIRSRMMLALLSQSQPISHH